MKSGVRAGFIVLGSLFVMNSPVAAATPEFDGDEVEVLTDKAQYSGSEPILVQAVYRNRGDRQWLAANSPATRRFQATALFFPISDTTTRPPALDYSPLFQSPVQTGSVSLYAQDVSQLYRVGGT